MVVIPPEHGDPGYATYLGVDGHAVRYYYEVGDSVIVLRSMRFEPDPYYRLTYTRKGADRFAVRFESSKDGKKFTTQVEGTCRKVK